MYWQGFYRIGSNPLRPIGERISGTNKRVVFSLFLARYNNLISQNIHLFDALVVVCDSPSAYYGYMKKVFHDGSSSIQTITDQPVFTEEEFLVCRNEKFVVDEYTFPLDITYNGLCSVIAPSATIDTIPYQNTDSCNIHSARDPPGTNYFRSIAQRAPIPIPFSSILFLI